MGNKQKINYKQKSEGGKKGGTTRARQLKEKATREYYENPSYCKNCGRIIELIVNKNGSIRKADTKKKIFCSKSCSATYNNKLRDSKIILKKCSNPECENFTGNPWFCSEYCSSRMLKINKIERFLLGELDDDSIRCNTIREYLITRQEGVCGVCKNPPIWNLKPIVFIVDHIDGNYENNSPENMRAICPNCNSQTDTFGSKNRINHKIKRPLPNKNRQTKKRNIPL
jgi:hypothetical protein